MFLLESLQISFIFALNVFPWQPLTPGNHSYIHAFKTNLRDNVSCPFSSFAIKQRCNLRLIKASHTENLQYTCCWRMCCIYRDATYRSFSCSSSYAHSYIYSYTYTYIYTYTHASILMHVFSALKSVKRYWVHLNIVFDPQYPQLYL